TVATAPLSAGIPAQPLRRALTTFAAETELALIYLSGVVGDQQSHVVAPGLAPHEALTQLLEGTGLRFKYLTAKSIRIFPAEPPKLAERTGQEPLSEVVITASRREETLQDVPITVQVLTGTVLDELNARNFDDFLNDLPGLTAHGVGPAQSNLYVRGLATVEPGQQASLIAGTFPSVAVYLDEQPAQFPSHNLDLYAVDLE